MRLATPFQESSKERSAMMQDAIATQLSSRGFTRVSEKPDLLVNIGIVVKEEVQTRTTDIRDAPRYMGQRNYHWESEEKVIDQYRVGTATVDLVDAATNALVWKSVVEHVIPDKDAKVAEAIQKGVQEMFSNSQQNNSCQSGSIFCIPGFTDRTDAPFRKK
jgi:hypothetical protein